jgi:diguanylate cyclase (GGDEF)-like protein/hemerythrin-like metal-binding protein
MGGDALAIAVLESLPCGVLVASRERVLLCNAHAARLLDRPASAVVHRRLEECFASTQRARLKQVLDALLSADAPVEPLELVAQRSDGSTVIVDARVGVLLHQGQRAVVVQISDAWERLRSTGSLTRLAFEDPVTGLPNRSRFVDELNKTLLRGKRKGDGFAIGLLDVDGFKSVNDNAGHEVGDVVLREIGARVRSAVRESDLVARLGGDEFTLLLPGIVDEAGALRVAGAVQRRLEGPFTVAGHAFTLGASLGLALFPRHGQDMQSLLVAADSAMYEGKRAGKGATKVFSGVAHGVHHHLARSLEWSSQLELGVPELDLEHRALVDALNALLEALSSAEPDEVVRRRLATLAELTGAHFANEESAMTACHYEGRVQHVTEHRELLRELHSIGDTLERRGLSQSIQLVRDWFLVHLREADRRFADTMSASKA